MRLPVASGGLLGLVLACGPAPLPPSPAPATSAPTPAAPTATSPTSAQPGQKPASSGWTAHEDPRQAIRKPQPVSDLASCVVNLRLGLWAGNAPGTEEYTQAIEDERRGPVDAARRSYLGVINDFPGSPLVPLAYLAFGELFAVEAETDPSKWELAALSFVEAAKFTRSEILAYATMRAADSFARTADPSRARALYKQAIVQGAKPSQQCGAYVVEQSRQNAR